MEGGRTMDDKSIQSDIFPAASVSLHHAIQTTVRSHVFAKLSGPQIALLDAYQVRDHNSMS